MLLISQMALLFYVAHKKSPQLDPFSSLNINITLLPIPNSVNYFDFSSIPLFFVDRSSERVSERAAYQRGATWAMMTPAPDRRSIDDHRTDSIAPLLHSFTHPFIHSPFHRKLRPHTRQRTCVIELAENCVSQLLKAIFSRGSSVVIQASPGKLCIDEADPRYRLFI